MRLALDTNVLVYAEGLNDAIKQKAVLALLDALPRSAVVLPTQVRCRTLPGSRAKSSANAGASPQRDAHLVRCSDIVETSLSVLLGAAELAATHRLRFWDGLVSLCR